MKNATNNIPFLGFWSYSNFFLIGEYFPNGGCTAEFKLEKTVVGFKAEIYTQAFALVPRLEKLWIKTKEITTMRGMESFLISIGLRKCNK